MYRCRVCRNYFSNYSKNHGHKKEGQDEAKLINIEEEYWLINDLNRRKNYGNAKEVCSSSKKQNLGKLEQGKKHWRKRHHEGKKEGTRLWELKGLASTDKKSKTEKIRWRKNRKMKNERNINVEEDSSSISWENLHHTRVTQAIPESIHHDQDALKD